MPKSIRNGQLGVTRMGLAKKLEGIPNHPINQGKLCTRGQAAAEITYHPDRVGHPLKRAGKRGDGKFEEISWDQALRELYRKLDALAGSNDQKSLAILTRPQRGLRNELMAQFANRFGAPAPLTFEFFGDEVVRKANELSFGNRSISDDRSWRIQICDFVWRRFLGHLEFAGRAKRRLWNTCVRGRPGMPRQIRAGGISDVPDRRECRRVGAG